MAAAIASTESGRARIRRVLVDAVEVLVSRETAERVVARALAMAQLHEAPEVGPRLRAFVEGPLADAIEATVGIHAADAFEDHVDDVLRAAALERERAPAPRRSDLGRLVLVATRDPSRGIGLARALARHANVEVIEDADALAPLLWARLASVVVLDYPSFPLAAETLEEMASAVCPQVGVLLWGAPVEVEETFLAAKPGTWAAVARRATPVHVAQLALALAGE